MMDAHLAYTRETIDFTAMERTSPKYKVILDLGVITIITVVTIVLAHTKGSLLIHYFSNYPWLCSFVAGIFLVSIFTAVPATAALGTLSLHFSLPVVALCSALGSALGDLGIFSFFKSAIANELRFLATGLHADERFKRFAGTHYRAWIIFIGIVLWILPIPDEIPLAILGISKTNTRLFIVLSLFINFCTALSIGLVARAFLLK